ncbi:MAG: DUF3782 domain-containing protein [Chloroflexota bacterium]
MAEKTWEDAAAEVWQLFKETDAKFKETDVKFKETDAKFKETQAELDRRFKETDTHLRRLEGLFGSQWGKMMEALVQPGALKLFQERGIPVHSIAPRIKHQRNGQTLELDLVLENETEVVILEVKSTLKVSDVTDFLADLGQLFAFVPRYRRYKVYAGVAGLDIVEDADRYAYRQGLFVVQVGGEGVVSLKNDPQFQPRDFAQAL